MEKVAAARGGLLASLVAATVAAAAVSSAPACADPQHTDSVDALGPEAQGVREGPQHRPGQPCTVCHGGDGPGDPEFVAAGTVYDRRGSFNGLEDVTVVLRDINGSTFSTRTNDVGNFYVEASRWAPTFPIFVELQFGGLTKKMDTRIGRDGGCGKCHQKNGDTSHNPAVYLKEASDP
jgi:hypothetical protein